MTPSSRVTTRELADAIAQLAEGQQQMVQVVQSLAANQQAMGERLEQLKTSREVQDELEAKLESPEQVRARLEQAPKVTVVHQGPEPRIVKIDGAGYLLQPGENVVPEPIARQYECALRDAEEGRQRREAIRAVRQMTNRDDTYGVMERIIHQH